jgi:hypothetical protein
MSILASYLPTRVKIAKLRHTIVAWSMIKLASGIFFIAILSKIAFSSFHIILSYLI